MDDPRLAREAAFHDARFSEQGREQTDKFYAVTASSKGRYRDLVLADSAGRRVLEYGCGPGSEAFELARRGAAVQGIDISEVAIAQARERAEAEGIAGRAAFEVMNAEALRFEDASFDLVCGSGILHHLDLRQAVRELQRVLRPDGRAVFFEPLGHNPLINLYRSMTPRLRTVDEHPLTMTDLRFVQGAFKDADADFYHLCALVAAPLHRSRVFPRVLRGLEAMDRVLFRWPWMRRQAWVVVLELSHPKRSTEC